MSAAAVVLGRLKIARDTADAASYVSTWDAARDERVTAVAVAAVMNTVHTRSSSAIVVELRPRHFEETACHFLRVATPVKWPVDEPDID